ncbi:uncharacterized protein BDR25DRAFT_313804 [Lindgomyces ingoldianus]|uniref:Uncharacterized protein n=1 Tax=Lindgomyces ingoldianus TaxID=673940 RepID=A0ACB6QW01_9PLEO|nr:uncharacterized protein BDR25DRAFT_313804 [Lindgomyces ingoldianus]KAF2471178.1 hypothetical protein BDR25DRAFT_313804 [Lindgomyces ingoldianus]
MKAREVQPPSPPQAQRKGGSDDSENVWEPLRTLLSVHTEEVSNGRESILISRLAQAHLRHRQQFSYWRRHKEKLAQHSIKSSHQALASRERGFMARNTPARNISTPENLLPQAPSVTTATLLQIPPQ